MASQVRELKWVRGTKFIVDGFRFQDPECRTYFLTHCHSVRSRPHSLSPVPACCDIVCLFTKTVT